MADTRILRNGTYTSNTATPRGYGYRIPIKYAHPYNMMRSGFEKDAARDFSQIFYPEIQRVRGAGKYIGDAGRFVGRQFGRAGRWVGRQASSAGKGIADAARRASRAFNDALPESSSTKRKKAIESVVDRVKDDKRLLGYPVTAEEVAESNKTIADLQRLENERLAAEAAHDASVANIRARLARDNPPVSTIEERRLHLPPDYPELTEEMVQRWSPDELEAVTMLENSRIRYAALAQRLRDIDEKLAKQRGYLHYKFKNNPKGLADALNKAEAEAHALRQTILGDILPISRDSTLAERSLPPEITSQIFGPRRGIIPGSVGGIPTLTPGDAEWFSGKIPEWLSGTEDAPLRQVFQNLPYLSTVIN